MGAGSPPAGTWSYADSHPVAAAGTTRLPQNCPPHHLTPPRRALHALCRFVIKTANEQGQKVFINLCGTNKLPLPPGWVKGQVPAEVRACPLWPSCLCGPASEHELGSMHAPRPEVPCRCSCRSSATWRWGGAARRRRACASRSAWGCLGWTQTTAGRSAWVRGRGRRAAARKANCRVGVAVPAAFLLHSTSGCAAAVLPILARLLMAPLL